MTPASLAPGAADALLFDLGRVVLDIDFSKAVGCWAAHAGCEPSDILARYVRDEAYRHHETGKISDAEYFESLRTSLGTTTTQARVLFAGLDGKPVGLPFSSKGFAEASAAFDTAEARRHSWWRRLWS